MSQVQEMTVASWQQVGKIDLMQKTKPTLKPGEILIKVAASGICGKYTIAT